MNPILIAESINAGYPGRMVLNGVSVSLMESSLLGIVGPNGCGKSTLLRVLAGQLRPQSGSVCWNGQDLVRQSTGWIAQRIARTPQSESIDWPATTLEMVQMGRAAHRGWIRPFTHDDLEIVQRCLVETGLSSVQHRRVTELSAGESQRMLIARALAQEPSILLLDEPTSHLDLKYQYELLALVRRLARERYLSVALVFHDLEQAAAWCDRVVVLKDGRKLGDGAPREIFSGELLSQVYDITVRVQFDAEGRLSVRV